MRSKLLLLLGLYLISIFIYLRYLCEHLPKKLEIIYVVNQHIYIINYGLLILVLVSIGIWTISFIVSLKVLQRKTLKNNIITNNIRKVGLIVKEALYEVHIIVVNFFDDSYFRMKPRLLAFQKLILNREYILFSLEVIVRIITCLIFLIDIFM